MNSNITLKPSDLKFGTDQATATGPPSQSTESSGLVSTSLPALFSNFTATAAAPSVVSSFTVTTGIGSGGAMAASMKGQTDSMGTQTDRKQGHVHRRRSPSPRHLASTMDTHDAKDSKGAKSMQDSKGGSRHSRRHASRSRSRSRSRSPSSSRSPSPIKSRLLGVGPSSNAPQCNVKGCEFFATPNKQTCSGHGLATVASLQKTLANRQAYAEWLSKWTPSLATKVQYAQLVQKIESKTDLGLITPLQLSAFLIEQKLVLNAAQCRSAIAVCYKQYETFCNLANNASPLLPVLLKRVVDDTFTSPTDGYAVVLLSRVVDREHLNAESGFEGDYHVNPSESDALHIQLALLPDHINLLW